MKSSTIFLHYCACYYKSTNFKSQFLFRTFNCELTITMNLPIYLYGFCSFVNTLKHDSTTAPVQLFTLSCKYALPPIVLSIASLMILLTSSTTKWFWKDKFRREMVNKCIMELTGISKSMDTSSLSSLLRYLFISF